MFCCRIPLVITLVFSLVVSSCATAAELKPSVSVKLTDRSAEVRWYPAVGPVKGRLVFGSGDGGWSYWEERVLQHLGKTCAVVGVDFSKYAEKDFDQATLAQDFGTLFELVKAKRPELRGRRIPVIFGGWSMGAEQAVAAVGHESMRNSPVCGLLLVAPGARGRYGLRLRDRVGLAPSGDGTFALGDFAAQLKGLRLAQFHARYDLLDTPGWADGLGLDLKRFDLPRGFHDFEGAGPDFLRLLDEAVAWILPHETPSNPEGK